MNRNIKSEARAWAYLYEAARERETAKHMFIRGKLKENRLSYFEYHNSKVNSLLTQAHRGKQS